MLRSFSHSCLTILRTEGNRILNRFDPPLVILLYHRVCDLPDDPFLLAVSPENFYYQLKFIQDNWPIIRLHDCFKKRANPAVAISFDDGYADNLINALPILEELKVPATFFVTTGYLDADREFWWDTLEYLDSESLSGLGNCFELHKKLKFMPPEERERHIALIRESFDHYAKCRESHRPLTVSELKQLAVSLWADIGAHGVSHTPFSALPKSAQFEEMKSSRATLQQKLQQNIELFSYPFGGKMDFTKDSAKCCRDAGFTVAVANIPGQVHRWTNPYQLPRNLVRNWPVERFAEQMGRFWTI